VIHIVDLDVDVQAAFIPIRQIEVGDPEVFLKDLRGRWRGIALQALDARYVAGPGHLRAVLKQAWEAKKRAVSSVEKLDVDVVMRIACDSRASDALKTVGLKQGLNDVVFVAIGQRDSIPSFSDIVHGLGERSDEVLNLTGEKEDFLKRHHGVEDAILEATLLKEGRLAATLAEKAAIELCGRR